MKRRLTILQVSALPEAAVKLLEDCFEVLNLHYPFDPAQIPQHRMQDIRGIVCTSSGPVDAPLIGRLPNLKIIACHSAGVEGIDTAAAYRGGIAVTNTSRVLAGDVADVAIGLLIAVARQFRAADRFVRSGSWERGEFPVSHNLAGARVGIIGLGAIGSAIAKRLDAIGAEVGYFGRKPKTDFSYPFFDDIEEIASWARALVISCPGGPATRHLVNAEVLERLGCSGWLINIARGSIVDERALIEALRTNAIAGAGLDVIENEPHVPAGLLESDRVFLLPHLASATMETRLAMARAVVEALKRHLEIE